MSVMASTLIKQLQELIEKHGDQAVVFSPDGYMSFEELRQNTPPCACFYDITVGAVVEESEFAILLEGGDTDEPYQVNSFCIN